MKNIIVLLLTGAFCLGIASLQAQATQPTIFIDKCIQPQTSNTFQSGERFTYKISISVSGGVFTDLTIEDQLPVHLGTLPELIDVPYIEDLPLPVITVTGGTLLYPSPYTAQYGSTVKITFPGTLDAMNTSFSSEFSITVQSKIGTAYECTTLNKSRAYASNIMCDSNPLVVKEFLSNEVCVNIQSQNDWQIEKKDPIYVGVNVVQYELVISRENSTPIGYYNLSNVLINDLAEPGATLTVSGATLGFTYGPSCPPPGSCLNINVNNLDVLNFLNGHEEKVFVQVEYPCPPFDPPHTVVNCVTMTGKGPVDCNKFDNFPQFSVFNPCKINSSNGICNIEGCLKVPHNPNDNFSSLHLGYDPAHLQEFITSTDCDTLTLPEVYTATASFTKRKVVPNSNNAPGCEGMFEVVLCNTGNVSLTNINIEDDWPDNLLNLQDYPPSVSGGSPVISFTGGTATNPDIIDFDFGNYSLAPYSCITILFNYDIPTTPPPNIGDLVTNCAVATFQGNLPGSSAPGCAAPFPFPVTQASDCETIQVEYPHPVPNICKSVVSGGQSYQPGDWVEYEICMSNYGGAPITGTLIDLLDPDFLPDVMDISYFCNPCSPSSCGSVSGACTSGWANFVSYNSMLSQLQWDINLPGICENNCYSTVCIRYKAQIQDYTPTGQHFNTATLTVDPVAPDYAGTTINDNASVTVVQLASSDFSKLVKGDLDAGFGTSGSCSPGSQVQFKILYKNTGNVPLTNLVIADWLPQFSPPNTYILNNTALGSDFDLLSPMVVSTTLLPSNTSLVPTTDIYPSLASTPLDMVKPACVSEACPTCPLPGSGNIFRLGFGDLVLQPAEEIEIIMQGSVPSTVLIGDKICNAAAMGVCNDVDDSALQYMNSNPVCAVVNPFVPSCCNKKEVSIQVQQAGSATNVNMGTNNLLHVEYDLTVTPFPIQEVRVSIVDLNLHYKPDNACIECYTSYNYLGVFDLTAVQPTLGSLTNISQFPTDMDLIYSGTPTMFSTAQTLELNIKLPVLESIPCCYVEGEVCLKFTFKDANCNYCERVVCLPVTY